MTVHTEEELERLSRLARREFSHALMSDTKWRKVFAVLDDCQLGLRQMRVKFTEVAEPKLMSLPTLGPEHTPRPYVDTMEFGPIEFRAIEWIDVPQTARVARTNHLPNAEVPQDLDSLEARLASSGSYPIERSTENLRIVGYRR